MFVVTRRKRIMGCYIFKKWTKENNLSDEIAINPIYFDKHPTLEIMQTLVHEMVHQWQFNHGEPSRTGYHNKEFAQKMESIGLMPSHTGKPGGKKTGQEMMDYAIKGGKFIKAAKRLLDQKAFKALWYDRKTIEQPTLASIGDSEEEPDMKKKVKYSCNTCEVNVWGKPGLHIICGACGQDFEIKA